MNRKTKMFRLLTVVLAAVMMVALSMNVMAAKSNAVNQDGLTAQLFTDKDSYKAGESVKASVQVDNHTGKEVFIFTEIKVPEGLKLASESAAFDALLKDGESWITPVGVLLSVNSAAAAGSATATGDNMQAGFWVILTALAVGGFIALFVYGKNRTAWLSVLLCLAMLSGMVVAAVPAQAAGNGDIQLSCAIQVDGKAETIDAIVSYVIYDDAEEDVISSEPSEAPSEPSEAPSEPSEAPSEPSEAPSEPSQAPSEPSEPETEVSVDTIYVSANAEAGEGDGSFDNPFANIEEAKARVREIKEADLYPESGITVYFRGGLYQVDDTISFTEADSGEEDAPVVYCAYQNEKVSFVGGCDIELSDFTAVTDATVQNRLAESAKSQIKQVDLGALGVTDLGELNMYGHSIGYFKTAGIDIPTAQPLEVFFDGETMNIARYPNDGWVYTGTVIDTGDVIQNWTSLADPPSAFVEESDRTYPPKGSEFTVDDTIKARMQNWTAANDIWVYGYWKENWSDQSMPVDSIDVQAGTVKTQYPSGKTMTAGKNFYFYNLLEELDAPGEYYIDRDTKMMYFYAPAESGTVTLSLLEGYMVELAKGTHDIEFKGMEFKAGRSNGFEVQAAENIKITDCDISKFADVAAWLTNCKNIVISGCHLYDLGQGGVSVSYDTTSEIGSDMIENLTPMGIVVENCEINNFSRISQTYSPAVRTAGVGMVVRNCKIHDSTHLAIDMRGNDTIIENNEIYDVLQTSNDAGVIYDVTRREQMGCIIRNNFIHDISSTAGNDLYVVYMDDTKDNVTVESNLFVNIKGGGVKINGGWDNNVRNNVFVNVDKTLQVNPMGLAAGEKYEITSASHFALFWEAVENPVYTNKYPHLIGLKEDGTEGGTLNKVEFLKLAKTNNVPMYNQVYDNVLINVDEDFGIRTSVGGTLWPDDAKKATNNFEASVVCELANSGFADIVSGEYTNDEKKNSVTLDNGDFTLNENSKIFELIPNFKAYDFSKIGKDNTCEKAGSLGSLNYEESDVLFFEDFVESDALSEWNITWDKSSSALDGNYAKVNSAEQLEVGLSKVDTEGTTGSVNMKKTFASYDGKLSYEMDFVIDAFGDDKTADIRVMIPTSSGSSIVNVGVKYKNDDYYFYAYDGGDGTKNAENMTTVKCEEDRLYHVKLVVDPNTDTYDLYIGDNLEIDDGFLRSKVSSFNGIFIPVSRTASGEAVVVYYDNILVQKLAKGVIPATGITINEGDALSVMKEDTIALTATVTPDYTTEKTVIWTSDKEGIATVNENGVVTGVAAGTATITAKAGTVTDTITITVTNEPIAVTSVTLDKETLEIGTSSVATLAATIAPYDATYKTVTWKSSDENVVTVDANGKLTAVEAGTATITATSDEKTATCAVTVDADIVLFDDLTNGMTDWTTSIKSNCKDCGYAVVTDDRKLEISTCGITGGFVDARKTIARTEKTSYEWDFMIVPEDYTTGYDAKVVIYNQNNVSVANVGASWRKFNGEETYCLYAYLGGVNETFNIQKCEPNTVYKMKLVLDPTPGVQSFELYINGDKVASYGELRSETTGFTTISCQTGKLAANNEAKAYYDDILVRKVVETTVAAEGVTINNGADSASVTVGNTTTLTAVVTPDNATDKTVTWSSGDVTKATVDANGVVTGVAAGTATITATVGTDITDTITVNVTAAPIEVTGVTLDKTTLEIGVGSVATLTATVAPADATDKTVAWSSNNTAVATVADGVVTGVAAGTATIIATTNGKTATCDVTVDSNIILFEDWTNGLTGWNKGDYHSGCTCGLSVTEAGELEIIPCSSHTPYVNVNKKTWTDKISIEYDMKVTCPTNCTTIDAKMMLKAAVGTSNDTTVANIAAYNVNRQKCEFRGYFASAVSQDVYGNPSIEVVSNQTYRIKIVADPSTKNCDVYVDDTALITGNTLNAGITEFTGIVLSVAKCTCDTHYKAYFDNIIIRKVASE